MHDIVPILWVPVFGISQHWNIVYVIGVKVINVPSWEDKASIV